jgi:hypothetical protein
MATSAYSCKHLLLCVIVLLVVVFMAGMVVEAVDDEAALRGAIQKAMTLVGCFPHARCKAEAHCRPGGICVSCALLFLSHSKIN